MPRRSLFRHHDFRMLWLGNTISQFGTSITTSVALPLLAVTVLRATPAQMGVLTAAETAAFLVIGLPAGVWADRARRRSIMIAADVGRALLLSTIPLAAWFGLLTLTQLIVIALLSGGLTVFFDVSYQSYLPSLVSRDLLSEGNAKLQGSQALAQVSAPALGGMVVQLVGAAGTLLIDVVSYLGSAATLARIRTVEPPPAPRNGRLLPEIGAGLGFVLRSPLLRPITACTATSNLFGGIETAMSVLFLSRVLGLSPAAVGFVVAAGSIGGVLGALSSGWVLRRVGEVRCIWLAIVVPAPFMALIPLAGAGLPTWSAAVGYGVFGYGVVVYNVAQVSFRQAICPDHLLGRMNASVRFLVWGTLPLGGLAGGLLAEHLGVRATLWVATVGLSLAGGWLLASPLLGMRDQPAQPEPPAGATEVCR